MENIMAKSTYTLKQEIYTAIDQLRENKINDVDPIILSRILNYVDNNAENIASLYEDSEENDWQVFKRSNGFAYHYDCGMNILKEWTEETVIFGAMD